MVAAKVWMPSDNNNITCSGCGKFIVPGEVYISENWHGSCPPAQCIRCGFARILAAVIDSPADHPIKHAIAALCKQPVREELHKIIREECTDPNGPISPGPNP